LEITPPKSNIIALEFIDLPFSNDKTLKT